MSKTLSLSGVSFVALGLILGAGSASGQTPAVNTAADEEVVVTGSRIQGTFTTPTPVTAITAEQLQVSGVTTLADALKQLPSVTPGGGPTAGGGTGNGGQNFIALRGLGAQRTLILVDGRRFTPSNNAGNVDTNIIPSGLVRRIDVVSGGASATYGSDAVGGVINFILDTSFEGLKVDAHYGMSERGDNIDQKITVDGGLKYAGDRGHLIASVEYYDNAGVKGDARAFRRTAQNEAIDPSNTAKFIHIEDLRTPFTTGSMIVNGAGGTAANNAAFRGVQFSTDGHAIPYSYGTVSNDIGTTSGTQNGGDGFRVSTGQEIVRPLNRQTFFLHNEFEITPNVTAFGEVSYGDTDSTFESSPTTQTITIQRANPYLLAAAPDIVARMTALGVTSLTLNRLTTERGPTYTDNRNVTVRGLAGLQGELAGWNWDIAYQAGKNRNLSPVYNNMVNAAAEPNYMALAADAVVDPSSGRIVCRSTLTNPTNGCSPFNPFGEGAPSTAALDYVMGTVAWTRTNTYQKGGNFNVSGKAFTLPAGDLSVAAGGEWRTIESVSVSDPLSNLGAFRLVNAQDFVGQYDIKEGYGEAQIPVVAGLPFIQEFNLNLAARYTDYSTSGAVTTWKVGGEWRVTDDLRLRATRSRDIRAPSLLDLFATGRQNNIQGFDQLTGLGYQGIPNRTFGNPDLKPEISNAVVAGFVYQPKFLPGFNVAIDYWDVRIDGAIGNIGAGNAIDQCFLSGQSSAVCAFVTRDPVTKAIVSTTTRPFNLSVQKATGFDFEANYRVPLDSWLSSDVGALNLRAVIGERAQNVTISPLVPLTINTARQQGNPKWRGNFSANYRNGPMRLDLVARYIGPQVWDKTRELGVTTDFMDIESATYLDGRFAWEVSKGKELYVNVQNILDKEPVYSPSTGGATPLPTDTGLYDQIGRMWTVGIRLSY